ncbi:MAG: L-aspartate oxidase [Parvibaculales bacterium]
MSGQNNIIDAGDVLIIGAGLAGLFTALSLSPRRCSVISPAPLGHGASTAWAQGGIAAALGKYDSPARHAEDTIKAGDGLVHDEIAHLLAEEAPQRIDDLLRMGVSFDRDEKGGLKLGQEGAHSKPRIVGVEGDRSGKEIMQVLKHATRNTPSIRMIEGFTAHELAVEDGRISGVFVSPAHSPFKETLLIKARAVVLASGGTGHLYAVTTNPPQASGEGLAMAARAGVQCVDMEFVQFHPTALAYGQSPAPLATEALRGEGAWLINGEGNRFLENELAPRDIVARAVAKEIERTGKVELKLPKKLAQHLDSAFPSIAASCKELGIDTTKEGIKVAPAAHYHMGGVVVDIWGRSSMEGLWICGETASSGAHGANRLASNSLLEALVFAARIAKDINANISEQKSGQAFTGQSTEQKSDIGNKANEHLRQIMTQKVGVRRNAEGLKQAVSAIRRIERSLTAEGVLSNRSMACLLIAASALKREESRGAHWRSDFPDKAKKATHNFMTLAQARALAEEQTELSDSFPIKEHGA